MVNVWYTSSRCTYNNGKLEGKYEKYYNNGDIQIQAYYEDGKRRALYDFNRINKKNKYNEKNI